MEESFEKAMWELADTELARISPSSEEEDEHNRPETEGSR